MEMEFYSAKDFAGFAPGCFRRPISVRQRVQSVLLLFFFTAVFLPESIIGQPLTVVNSIDVQPKVNGLLLRLSLSAPVAEDHLAGWQAQNDWFYVTLFQCQSDSAALMKSFRPGSGLDQMEVLNSRESTQLAFSLHSQVEAFEFQLNEPRIIDIALRFPRTEVLAALESEAMIREPESSGPGRVAKPRESPFYLRMRSAAYLIGVSLTVSGILANDNQSQSGWELPAGVSILGLTYIYDHFLHPRFHHE